MDKSGAQTDIGSLRPVKILLFKNWKNQIMT